MNVDQIVTELFNLVEKLPKKMPQKFYEDFSRGELFLLNYLYNRGGSAHPSDMSDALQTSTARIAAALNSLENKGWVKREHDEEDGRKKIVYLTIKGSEYVEECRDKAKQKITILFEALGEEDATEYLRILNKMIIISRDFNFDLSD